MKKLSIWLLALSGMTNAARGVAQTIAVASTPTSTGARSCDPPGFETQTMEPQCFPTFLGVAVPGDDEQHDQHRQSRGGHVPGCDELGSDVERPDVQCHRQGHEQHEYCEAGRLVRTGKLREHVRTLLPAKDLRGVPAERRITTRVSHLWSNLSAHPVSPGTVQLRMDETLWILHALRTLEEPVHDDHQGQHHDAAHNARRKLAA